MHKIIVANYKMNGSKKLYRHILNKLNKLELKDTALILCPPFLYVPFFKISNDAIHLGVQDISNTINKKSTGQISPKMAKEFGAEYSIVGHSERRSLGETDELINQKINVLLSSDMTPILCVGEKSKDENLNIVLKQLKDAIKGIKNHFELIIAYEPVWAIGTGEIPSIAHVNKVAKSLRKFLDKVDADYKILYGGSISDENYQDMARSEIDGFLIGGISLEVNKFIEIIKGIDNE